MTILIGQELKNRAGRAMSAEAHSARSLFAGKKARTKTEQAEQDHRKKKQYLVKGRVSGSAVLWDVFKLEGFSEPEIVGSGFAFQEEAILFARDRSLGRMVVGMGNVRGMFKVGNGGVLSPTGRIDRPHEANVKVKQTSSGVIVG